MRFGSLLVAGFAALAAAIPANKVVENIQMVTSQSQQLMTPAKNLQLLDGPLLVTGQGNFPVSVPPPPPPSSFRVPSTYMQKSETN